MTDTIGIVLELSVAQAILIDLNNGLGLTPAQEKAIESALEVALGAVDVTTKPFVPQG